MRAANLAVFEERRRNPGQEGMGTTLTAMRIASPFVVLGHFGDSRLYYLRVSVIAKIEGVQIAKIAGRGAS